MNGVLLPLFWKEVREHQGRAAASLAVLLGAPLTIFVPSGGWEYGKHEATILTLWFTAIVFSPCAAVFSGMGIAARERANGTLDSLRVLPTSPWRPALVKLVAGLGSILIPATIVLLLGALIEQWYMVDIERSSRELFNLFGRMPRALTTDYWMADALFNVTIGLFSLVLWSAVLGARAANEIQAAVPTLVGIALLWLVWFVVSNTLKPIGVGDRWFLDTIAAALPGGIFMVWELNDGTYRWVFVAFGYLVAHGLLLRWWLENYGALAPTPKRIPKTALIRPSASQTPLAPPMRNRNLAIAGYAGRRALAVVAASVVMASVWAAILAVSSGIHNRVQEAVEIFLFTVLAGGFVAALLAGIAVLIDDLRPGVSHFWRSRPIDPGRWFTIKFSGGLAVLAIAYGAVTLIALAYHVFRSVGFQPLIDGALAWELMVHGPAAIEWEYVVYGLCPALLLYGATTCVFVVVRQPLYAIVLSWAVFVILLGIGVSANELVPLGVTAAVLLTESVLVTLAAWLAVRYDWALKR